MSDRSKADDQPSKKASETRIIKTTDPGSQNNNELSSQPQQQKPKKQHRAPAPTKSEVIAIGELSGRAAEERYKLYRPDFQRHYEEHFAALGAGSFDEYARAYRYGMALATSETHRGESWSDVASEAREQWNARMHRPWESFREAVRFGWYRIRGQEEMYGGHAR